MHQTDLFAIALAQIGNATRTAESLRLCEQFYPLARDTVFAQHAWGFATRCERLTQREVNRLAPGQWAYDLPSDALRILAVQDQQGIPCPYEQQHVGVPANTAAHTTVIPILVTMTAPAYIKAVWLDKQDEEVLPYPPLVCEAIAWKLSSLLAGSLIHNAQTVQDCLRQQQLALQQAMAWDAQAQHIVNPFFLTVER